MKELVRPLLWGLVGGLTALSLSACSTGVSRDSDQKLPSGDGVYVFTQEVNGRVIPCIWVNGYRSGSLSCDWGTR